MFLSAPGRWVPILIMEGKPPEHIQWPSTLLAADRQVRHRYALTICLTLHIRCADRLLLILRFPDLHKLKLMPIPGLNPPGGDAVRPEFLLTRLYGLSAIGWRIRSYTYDMGERRVTDPPYAKPPPADGWAIDIRTEEGCNEVNRIVTLVVEECRAAGVLE